MAGGEDIQATGTRLSHTYEDTRRASERGQLRFRVKWTF